MKKYLTILILFIITNLEVFAQEGNEAFALQSLEFFNQKFHLNLIKINEPILIIINNDYEYICNKYITLNKVPEILEVKRKLYLYKKANNKYEFHLKCSSEYTGTLEVSEEKDEKFKFIKLEYIQKTD